MIAAVLAALVTGTVSIVTTVYVVTWRIRRRARGRML